jgi:hypothetical protein
MDLDEEIGAEEEETGWKLIHGDVFRFPQHKMLFSAAQGAGLARWLDLLQAARYLLCSACK